MMALKSAEESGRFTAVVAQSAARTDELIGNVHVGRESDS
jgi:hypothetical protein